MGSKLEQLMSMTTIVAETGDLAAVARLKPVDCTTDPTIVLKALGTEALRSVVDEALSWGRQRSGHPAHVAAATTDRLVVSVGIELLKLVPGCVSNQVDANLSFHIEASVAKAHQIIADYSQRGIARPRTHQTRIDDTSRGGPAARRHQV